MEAQLAAQGAGSGDAAPPARFGGADSSRGTHIPRGAAREVTAAHPRRAIPCRGARAGRSARGVGPPPPGPRARDPDARIRPPASRLALRRRVSGGAPHACGAAPRRSRGQHVTAASPGQAARRPPGPAPAPGGGTRRAGPPCRAQAPGPPARTRGRAGEARVGRRARARRPGGACPSPLAILPAPLAHTAPLHPRPPSHAGAGAFGRR